METEQYFMAWNKYMELQWVIGRVYDGEYIVKGQIDPSFYNDFRSGLDNASGEPDTYLTNIMREMDYMLHVYEQEYKHYDTKLVIFNKLHTTSDIENRKDTHIKELMSERDKRTMQHNMVEYMITNISKKIFPATIKF